MSTSDSQSTRPAMPLWLLLVTLLGGAFLFQRGKNTGDEKAAPNSTAVIAGAEAKTSDDRLLAPLREFFGLPLSPTADAETLGDLQFKNSLAGGGRLQSSTEWIGQAKDAAKTQSVSELSEQLNNTVGLLEFLIVSVADPVDTSLNYRFDLQLDTLHKALEVDGYVPDHYYLPWRSAENAKTGLHRTEPGVLLYRRNGESKAECDNPQERYDLLLVYLVGETPTSGVHKEAFLKAVRQIRDLGSHKRRSQSDAAATIQVAGPVFTGASDSLAFAIRQACDDQKKGEDRAAQRVTFQVITGAAVAINRDRFHAMAGASNVDLHSTVLSGNVMKKALIDHVMQREKNVRIAWLTETGTGYGQSVAGPKKKGEKFSKRGGQDAADANKANASQAARSRAARNGKIRQPEIIEFRFPINISRVRSGYAESRRRERSSQIGLGPETSRLPIPFEDTGTARDVPPMQTPQVTAPTAELILAQILRRIRHERIKYVGISSSDPRDPIFLAELIQEQCPDVQIMLVTSDVLHLHSEYRSIMHGTLVASAYPLNPEALDLCFPFGEDRDGSARSIVLSSQSNYGLYNAILFLRGLQREQYVHDSHSNEKGNVPKPTDNELKLRYTTKDEWPGGLPVGYSMPFEEEAWTGEKLLRPPVWISRIGINGIFPITVREAAEDDYTLGLKIEVPPPEKEWHQLRVGGRVPTSMTIASLLWLALAVTYCAAWWFPTSIGNWAKALAISRGQSQDFRALTRIFRALITASLISVLMLFGTLLRAQYYRVERDLGYVVTWTLVHCILCHLVAIVLGICLLTDWFRALGGLVMELSSPTASPATQPVIPGLKRHLLTARAVGLAIVFSLMFVFWWTAWGQNNEWRDNSLADDRYHPDSYLWFMRNSDMWNGLSPAMTAQLQAVVLIILAYGMLHQMHLLSPEFTIIRPDLSPFAQPSEESCQKRQEFVRSDLLFPVLSRWRRDQPWVVYVLGVLAALFWLGYLAVNVQSVDHFSWPISFPTTLLLVAGGFWCVRFCKLILILNGLSRQLTQLVGELRNRWPRDWPQIFTLLDEKPIDLQELFWSKRPLAKERCEAREAMKTSYASDTERELAEKKLCAIEIELYVRQFFHHIVRLGLGLAVAACLLFLSAHTFPYSQEPLVRLSASIMLAAIGGVMLYYYLKFDRNELLSHLVGTEAKRVSINWSLVQMVAPAVLLMAVALLSQTFPQVWQWMRDVLAPMARSSA